jgi:hypothetical protein
MITRMMHNQEHSKSHQWRVEENLVVQIRREMRFFQDKELPGYNVELAAQLHLQLKTSFLKLKRSPHVLEVRPNDLYPVIRSFELLINDLELYLKDRTDIEPHKRAEDVNVLAPMKQLILAFQRRLNTNMNLNGNHRIAP